VIGSGATAVTLVPELSKRAAHVTMLQRSPTYIVSLPAEDAIANFHPRKNIGAPRYVLADPMERTCSSGWVMFKFCAALPRAGEEAPREASPKALGDEHTEKQLHAQLRSVDQRLCLVPDADLFEAIKDKRVSVVTDHIETFTEKGIRLKSGDELEADLVVTATGLKIEMSRRHRAGDRRHAGRAVEDAGSTKE